MAIGSMDYKRPQSEIFAGAMLTSSKNLNNITDYGLYAWTSSDRPTNAPESAGSGGMLVMRIATGGVLQFVVNDQNIYYRAYFSTGWTSWRKLTGSAIS